MKERLNYEVEAEKLARAADIANESLIRFPPRNWSKENVDHFVKCHLEWKDWALNPEPQFKKIASLKYIIESVFTYFNEGSGEAVEYFWKRITEENLNYKRKDKLDKILKRGKIKGRIEYDYLVDTLIAFHQNQRISDSEFETLNSMIGDFENVKKN